MRNTKEAGLSPGIAIKMVENKIDNIVMCAAWQCELEERTSEMSQF